MNKYVLIIQTLIAAIKQVEQLMPDSKGKEKFDAAIAVVEGVVGSVAPLVPVLLGVATTVVNGLRHTGEFQPTKAAT